MTADPPGLVYGVDVTRFRDSDGDGIGDLRGLIDRLDHLAELGVSWLWLLPIYPSARRDNGYDVDDHQAIDPRLGTFAEFDELVRGCHARGIRVLMDLVVHHTSDRHPWFLAAREDRGSRLGRFYVWADEPVQDPDDRNVFPGEEDGVWHWDEKAHAYYHHQFYAFQPDLNFANPDVVEAVTGIARFWRERGVDGFRIDAAVPAVRGKTVPGTQADAVEVYRRLRAGLGDDVFLVAEADVPPAEVGPLLGPDRMDAILDFTLNNHLFLAFARGEAAPLREALASLDAHVPPVARVNFVRNVDELDLEQLDDDERREVFDAFAPDERMLLYGRGLRRGWAPLLAPRPRYRMSLSLLMALPGLPLLMQGQELGVGDDLGAPDRSACRPVMQWADAPGAGFSDDPHSPLILPAQLDGPFDVAHVNAAEQAADPDSNLALARRLARLRAERCGDVLAARAWAVPGAPGVVALGAGGTTTLHNLSDVPQQVPEAAGRMLLGEGWDGGTLAPYGFAWLAAE
ncbi:alpha-amylase family glycosyl hydrolase [Gryllotalpicola ginsengisoli]|uniref:alpha-amylase family glycosyl hydrolase n=1 Tax=Gryllotalpicola ginsengisoli TaxID=444608 RepID=UPI0003B6D96B|nr:alpha-amylase family glycosyl hydrolase [Gryllotalpicola ginsengisoli]